MGSALSLPRNMEKAVLMMAKKVLIVEDDSNIAELLNLYLEKEGFEPLVAKDRRQGGWSSSGLSSPTWCCWTSCCR